MQGFDEQNPQGRRGPGRRKDSATKRSGPPPESTGEQAAYLRSLIDSKREIVITLKSGEKVAGHLRYFDRECFSLKVSETGLNVLFRSDDILYLAEK